MVRRTKEAERVTVKVMARQTKETRVKEKAKDTKRVKAEKVKNIQRSVLRTTKAKRVKEMAKGKAKETKMLRRPTKVKVLKEIASAKAKAKEMNRGVQGGKVKVRRSKSQRNHLPKIKR